MRLLDTNVCIHLLNNAQSSLWPKLRQLPRAEVALCDIVKAELYYGIEKSRHPARNQIHLEAFLVAFTSFPFDGGAARAFGRIKAELTRNGIPIGPHDFLIAAIALANDLTLVTANVSEFKRVRGLRVENWETS
jgi:tRNA(fMet)-specific endonuclease VapC